MRIDWLFNVFTTLYYFFLFWLGKVKIPLIQESRNRVENVLQKVSGSGKEMGQAYVNFTRNCMDQIRSKVIDELWILNFSEVIILCI